MKSLKNTVGADGYACAHWSIVSPCFGLEHSYTFGVGFTQCGYSKEQLLGAVAMGLL